MKGRPRRALVGLGEKGLDPGGVEVFPGPRPAVRPGPEAFRIDLDLFPALAENDREFSGGCGGEFRRDPERGAASPFRLMGFDVAGRSAEREPDFGGIGFEGGQDAERRAGARGFRGDQNGARTGERRSDRAENGGRF
ncbi:MAG: hypothetical protein A2V76_05240 [Candidatus Aminicenantes bacterium RBG_16_63_14]|nr:MAG: hypothetical protein A2V76_05240 [Candidatus Aminicenantes bacterium RBG_16_63_14]